jgi:hypothetical protein
MLTAGPDWKSHNLPSSAVLMTRIRAGTWSVTWSVFTASLTDSDLLTLYGHQQISDLPCNLPCDLF